MAPTYGVAGPSSSSVAPTVAATKVWLNCQVGGACPSRIDSPSKGTAFGKRVMFCKEEREMGDRGWWAEGQRTADGGREEVAG